MKTLKALLPAIVLAVFATCSFACSDSNSSEPEPTPVPTPEPDPAPTVTTTTHFDLFLTIGRHGGMGRGDGTIVRSVESLAADQGVISVEGVGAELGTYSLECIQRGKYYYQVPSSNDRFVKYQIKDNSVEVVAQQPFVTNSYETRKYAHAWIGSDTLVVVAADGSAEHILWTMLNADDMSVLGEGTLDISVAEGYEMLTTTGALAYRESDGKLFYFYYSKKGRSRFYSVGEPKFHVAVINPATMEIEHESLSPIDAATAGSAFGELLQNFVMFDDDDNLYIAVSIDQDDGTLIGDLLRINVGELEFDPSYHGYRNADGKLMTVQYIGNNKAFIYARNDHAPEVTGGDGKTIKPTSIDGYSHYYAILDLTTGQAERIKYNGTELDYSGGLYSQRSVVTGGKVYFATSTQADANSVVYIYDIATGTVERGAEVEGTNFFDMLRAVED